METKAKKGSVRRSSSMNRMTVGDKVFEVVNCIFLGLIACIILYPLIYVVSASFSDAMAVTSGKMWLWPVDVTLENYQQVFKNDNIMPETPSKTIPNITKILGLILLPIVPMNVTVVNAPIPRGIIARPDK